MSAVIFAVDPTVSFPLSSWIDPSIRPSITRSSVPVISPFTRKLDPSRPVWRSPVESNERGVLVVSKVFASGATAWGVSDFFVPHMGPPPDHAPRGLPNWGGPPQNSLARLRVTRKGTLVQRAHQATECLSCATTSIRLLHSTVAVD